MSKRRHRARSKTVQKMTRDGLVQENLATGENIKISNRQVEQEFHRSTEPTATQEVRSSTQSSHAQYSASQRARQAISEQSVTATSEPSFHSDHLSYTDRSMTGNNPLETEPSHPAFSQEYSSHFQQTAPQTAGIDTTRSDAPITRDTESLHYNNVASPRNAPEPALNAPADQN
ncbi:MAG: hypothetical protein LUI07_09100 [Lachnospiraceae bacterium]|nr:hypothetical protein [Lachnospiraceae bacterium]